MMCLPVSARYLGMFPVGFSLQGRGGGEKLKKQFEALAEGTGIEVGPGLSRVPHDMGTSTGGL